MKLSLEMIHAITFGTVEISLETDGIHFYKCTRKQIAAWTTLAPFLGERAETTTGIRLDFHTDTKRFAFRTGQGNKFEIYVNGLPAGRFEMDKLRTEGKAAEIFLDNSTEMNRITVYFPSHDNGVLTDVELDDGAKILPHIFSRRILFLGDSITQGWDSFYDSLSYAYRTARFFEADSLIQGVGGGYFHASTLDRLPYDPDTIIVAYGTNDFFGGYFTSTEELHRHTKEFLDGVSTLYGKKKVYLITPIWRAGEERLQPLGHFSDYRNLLWREAEQRGFLPIDGTALVPHDSAFFADKTLHPNDLGFGIYAENLTRAMLKK